jgi:CRISPR-associated endonuclease/helicase Cas3
MNIEDFSVFYGAAHPGKSPFPWQVDMVSRACKGDWPSAIGLPTASGKTSVLDIAVFALAFQYDQPAWSRTAALRTALVVDRRVVVDDAWRHALEIQRALYDPKAPLAVREIARRLSVLSGNEDGSPILHVVRLRGGVDRDEHGFRSPTVPTLVLSTVDQVGSRLLFRGYGVPPRSRSIHAGLFGMDCRIFLDEAHLSAPFLDTVQTCSMLQHAATRARELPLPVQIIAMSATPRESSDVLRLSQADLDNEVLRDRLTVPKPATLEVTDNLVERAADLAVDEARAGQVVGVVVNRVAAATEIARRVSEALSGTVDVVLLTGRMRPLDRDERLGRIMPLIRNGRDRPAPKDGEDVAQPRSLRPAVVVATQTVEVGADLDFDVLITEAAPLDALRQRFGRLNRAGGAGPTPAWILARKADLGGRNAGKDPLYGDRLLRTWEWLQETAVAVDGLPQVDFGVLALSERLDQAGDLRATLESSPPDVPVMMPSHVRAWSQTHPAPVPDPVVAPYLHGPAALEAADVSVIWRADLDPYGEGEEERRRWFDLVDGAPPRASEAMPVPRKQVLRWLAGEPAGESGDVPVSGDTEETPRVLPRPVLRWGSDDKEPTTQAADIRPGDVLVVPSSYGGVDPRIGAWDPTSQAPVADLGHVGQSRVRRLHPSLLPEDGGPERREALLADYDALLDPDLDADERKAIRRRMAGRFMAQTPVKVVPYAPRAEGGSWLIAVYPKPARSKLVNPYASDDDVEDHGDGFADDDESSATGKRYSLEQHSREVHDQVDAYGVRLHLSEGLRWLVARAAWFHDIGKADPRMQHWLTEGEGQTDASGRRQLVAKSNMRREDRKRNRVARAASGYPPGARHEMMSVALLQSVDSSQLGVEDDDLLLHLVGTHHGHGRGLPPAFLESAPVDVHLEHGDLTFRSSSATTHHRLDAGWVERFRRLEERYGAWGLAWLEALVRLADFRCSERAADEGGE